MDKRLTNKKWKENDDVFNDCYGCYYECAYCSLNYEALRRLAEFEDKIENGTLIELPCKVGDKAYIIYKNYVKYYVYEITVIEIYFSHTGNLCILDSYNNVYDAEKVYSTREQAEEKLKELNKE